VCVGRHGVAADERHRTAARRGWAAVLSGAIQELEARRPCAAATRCG
jgi:hypothetical protein